MKKLKMMMACVLAVFALGACDDQDLGNRSETQTIATDGDLDSSISPVTMLKRSPWSEMTEVCFCRASEAWNGSTAA